MIPETMITFENKLSVKLSDVEKLVEAALSLAGRYERIGLTGIEESAQWDSFIRDLANAAIPFRKPKQSEKVVPEISKFHGISAYEIIEVMTKLEAKLDERATHIYSLIHHLQEQLVAANNREFERVAKEAKKQVMK